MNVIRFECRRYLFSTLVWTCALTLFAALCIQLFVSFTADMKLFETLMSAYPPAMLKAFGAELSSITTLMGFYGFCFMYVVAIAAFQATYMGMHIISKEISGKSADFLFTKPLSRMRILSYKLCSAILCLLLVNCIYSVGTYCSALLSEVSFDTTMLLYINASMFLTQLLFLSLGFFLACVLHKIKTPLTLTSGIVCAFFLLQMIVNLEPQGGLSYFSFLSYLRVDEVLAHHGYEMSKLLLLSSVSVVFFSSGYWIFAHRDVQAL